MGPLVIVEPEVGAQLPLGLTGTGVSFQVHLLVFHRAPQPLHEDAVRVPPLPLHADLDPVVLKYPGELTAGELAALAGVEHLRPALPQRLCQRLDTEVRIQGVGLPPCHLVPAVPIRNGHQVQKAPGHGQVGDVGRPHLVGASDFDLFQQIRKDWLPRRWPAGAGPTVDGPQSHDAHQPLHPLPAHILFPVAPAR